MNLEFPEHKGSLTLTHNEHRDYYETVAEWEARAIRDSSCGPSFNWVSEEQRQKAILTDEVWVLHWYPDSPVGFIELAAADLDALLRAARE